MVRTPSVARWQLIFIGTVTTLMVVVVGFRGELLATPTFTAGFVLAVIATLVALIVPWERLPRMAALAIPALDTVAVGLLNANPDFRLGLLWVFPVTWVATYYSAWIITAQMALVAVLALTLAHDLGDPSAMALRLMIILLSLTFLAMTIRIGARRGKVSRTLVSRQSTRTARAAERAEAHRQQVVQIIDALHTALAAVRADGTIANHNDAYMRLYGLNDASSSLPGFAVEYDDFQGEPIPTALSARSRAARGEILQAERVWLFDEHRRWRALEVTTEPLASASEDQPTTLLIIDDVTERLAAESQRREMAAVISHELRNPLTAILGHLELAQERPDLPRGLRDNLDVMARAGERMQQLVAHILDRSRDTAAPLREPVDLRQVAEASVEAFTPTAQTAGLSLRLKGAETLRIVGDAFRLRQALDNLLSNAVKYTPAEGTITVRLSLGTDGCAEVVIIDTGEGIPADELPHIFEQFYRAEAATHGQSPGAGMGMGITHSIVTEHGGTLDVTSAVGEGTTVTMRFPGWEDTSTRPLAKEKP